MAEGGLVAMPWNGTDGRAVGIQVRVDVDTECSDADISSANGSESPMM